MTQQKRKTQQSLFTVQKFTSHERNKICPGNKDCERGLTLQKIELTLQIQLTLPKRNTVSRELDGVSLFEKSNRIESGIVSSVVIYDM